MEDTTMAGGSSLPPETTIVPSPRGQKRGAPDEDEAAGAGADRGSPRRAAGVDAVVEEEEESSMELAEEKEDEDEEELDEPEDDAPPARRLFDFFHVHPSAAADDRETAGSSSTATAGPEPVDVTLRLGVGPLGDDRGGALDTTLSQRLGEDDGGFGRLHGEPVVSAMPQGAASDAEPDFDDDVVFACNVAADPSPSDVPSASTPPPEDEGFLTVDHSTIDCFAATAEDGASAADDAAGSGRRPSSVLDLNKPCPSEFPDGAPGTSRAPVDDDYAADVDERPAVAAVEQRHRSRALLVDLFCSPARDVRAPGVLAADSI